MKKLLFTTAFAVALCGVASASPISINSSLGTWNNVLGGTNVAGVGNNPAVPPFTNFIEWGIPGNINDNPLGLKSGYEYNGATPPPLAWDTTNLGLFKIGTFTHHNNAIEPGTSITGATLNIVLDLGIPGPATTNSVSFAYDFEHIETDNGQNPCQFGPGDGATNIVPCDDRVRILNSIPTTNFLVGSTLYTLQVVGFSKDGGVTTSDTFFTTEGLNNSADLYGRITSDILTLPEPGTMFMVCGAGLIGLARLLRKKSVN